MSERTPIEPDEIRVGDTIRTESRDGTPFDSRGTVASEWIATGEEVARPFSSQVDLFLIDRPEQADDPARHLPAEPTLGWAVVGGEHHPGMWVVHRSPQPPWSGKRETLVFLLQREREVPASDVDDFVEGVLVQRSALDALLLAYPSRTGAPLEPVDHFLRVVVNDR